MYNPSDCIVVYWYLAVNLVITDGCASLEFGLIYGKCSLENNLYPREDSERLSYRIVWQIL